MRRRDVAAQQPPRNQERKQTFQLVNVDVALAGDMQRTQQRVQRHVGGPRSARRKDRVPAMGWVGVLFGVCFYLKMGFKFKKTNQK